MHKCIQTEYEFTILLMRFEWQYRMYYFRMRFVQSLVRQIDLPMCFALCSVESVQYGHIQLSELHDSLHR